VFPGCLPVAILFAVRILLCALCAIVAKPPQAFIDICHHIRGPKYVSPLEQMLALGVTSA
jgi:hypothetical protein